MNKKHIYVMVLLLIIFQASWGAITLAKKHSSYVSDEIWYVSASRDLLFKLGIPPSYTQGHYAGLNIFVTINPQTAADYIYNALTLQGINASISIIPTPRVVYLMIPTNKKTQVETLLSNMPFVQKIVPGYYYPDVRGIGGYYNLEHPGLVKELIMVSMLLFGDKPFSWRIPVIVLYAVSLLMVAMIVKELTNSLLASVFSLILAATSYPLRVMGSTSMLETYVGAFFLIALWFYVKGDSLGVWVGIALSIASKFTMLFPSALLWYYSIKNASKKTLVMSLLFIVGLFIALNAAVIYAIGFDTWARNLIGSLFFHLEPKVPQVQETSVFSWFEGYALWFMGTKTYYAIPQPVFWVLVFLTFRLWKSKVFRELASLYFSGIFFFVYLYIVGGQTQFAYYYTPLEYLSYVLLGVGLYELGIFSEFSWNLTNKFKATLNNRKDENHTFSGGVGYEKVEGEP